MNKFSVRRCEKNQCESSIVPIVMKTIENNFNKRNFFDFAFFSNFSWFLGKVGQKTKIFEILDDFNVFLGFYDPYCILMFYTGKIHIFTFLPLKM